MRIKIAEILPDSPACSAGLCRGDEISTLGGVVPRDVLDYARLAASPDTFAELSDGRQVPAAALTGAKLDQAVFDGVQTCDNHCEFCFIYQLPKGLRPSLYLKDDDYRLSAMYGNFTTLTRFTEVDLERVIDERISPLNVSVHATDPFVRARMLRNPKGGMSLRWLRAILDHGIEVHAQIVCCPGTNDGPVLTQTLADLLLGFSELSSVGVVPLGVSDHSTEQGLRPPTPDDARRMLDTITHFGDLAMQRLGRRFVFGSDELYLLAGRPFPPAAEYEDFPQYENGIGMAAALTHDFASVLAQVRAQNVPREALPSTEPERQLCESTHAMPDCTQSKVNVAATAAPPWGYRSDRLEGRPVNAPRQASRTAILTSTLGAPVVTPLLEEFLLEGVEVVVVPNRFFGGNIGVTGLLAGVDLLEALQTLPPGMEAVLPDVVFHEGRTLDGMTLDELAAGSDSPLRVVTSDASGLCAAVRR